MVWNQTSSRILNIDDKNNEAVTAVETEMDLKVCNFREN